MHISLLIQLKQLFHWIEDLYFGQKQRFRVKNALVMNLFLKLYKTLIRLESCGLLVDYCDVFFSCLDSHSDGTHSLHRIHWWASDVKRNFSKTKKTCLHIGLEYYWWKELAHKTVWTGLLCTGYAVHFLLLKKKNSWIICSWIRKHKLRCTVCFFSAAHEDN